MRKKMLEEIISDYGIDGNVVNDLAKAIREYYKDVILRKVSESIWSNKNIIIPMADVQHIEKIEHGYNSSDGRTKKEDLSGIKVITKHTRWDMDADTWSNNIWISNYEKAAKRFIRDWCFYRYEKEGGSKAFKQPDELTKE